MGSNLPLKSLDEYLTPRGKKRFEAFLRGVLLSISLFILITPCLHHYQDLIETEFYSHHLSFEHSHVEDICLHGKTEFLALQSDDSFKFVIFLPSFNPLDRVFNLSFPDPQKQDTVLRC